MGAESEMLLARLGFSPAITHVEAGLRSFDNTMPRGLAAGDSDTELGPPRRRQNA